jgi:hypothetical protein
VKNEALQILHKDFAICKKFLQTVSLALRKDGVSKYPIFVALHEDIDLDIGVPIIRSEETGTYFSINASHLEDFVNKKIIEKEKAEIFISNYKDPEKFCCIFFSEPEVSSFAFIPYSNDTVWEPKNREQLN